MQNENDMKILENKANVFFRTQQIVHITFKKGYWKRGTIKEISSDDDFFMLQERKEGLIPVFFLEIEDINKFIDEKERGTWNKQN